MVTAMSSNENPDQEIERVLQSHFESEAEGLKAPAGLWGRIEARLGDVVGGGVVPPVWQRLVRPGRWGLPALAAVALLVVAFSVALLATTASFQSDESTDSFRLAQVRDTAAFPAATAAPAPTAVPAASQPAGARGAAGAAGPAASTGTRGQLETVQRQIISQGSVSLDVEDVPSATVQVRSIAESVGGFVEQLSSQGVEERQQSTMTIRVPQPEFFNVFDRIKSLGKVLNENAGSEDVTERFIDLEARLKSADREELSLLSLLERAEKVSEILTIERELSRIRTELEQVQGQINFLERRVNLATIIVALFPPQFRVGQPPSASLSLEVSDVSQRVEEVKAVVFAAGGEFDEVLISSRDGAERASLTVRVFAQDFNRVVSSIESQGEVKRKEVQEGIGPIDAETAIPEEPDSRIGVEFAEEESSSAWRWVAIGAAALVVILGFLFYVTYQFGQRRGEMK